MFLVECCLCFCSCCCRHASVRLCYYILLKTFPQAFPPGFPPELSASFPRAFRHILPDLCVSFEHFSSLSASFAQTLSAGPIPQALWGPNGTYYTVAGSAYSASPQSFPRGNVQIGIVLGKIDFPLHSAGKRLDRKRLK